MYPLNNVIFSHDTPAGTLKGTIVLLTGSGGNLGTLDGNFDFAYDYFKASYEIVQIAWPSDWEQTSDTFGMMTGACRPAGFLDYVRTTASLNARLTNSSAGLCAQGASAGSGALGYSLAWYKDSAGNYLSTDLDNVELLSGPVFSNVKFGCQFPPPPSGYNVVCHTGQFGCSPGTTTWSSGLQYVGAALTGIRSWTGDVTCNNGSTTSSSSNSNWLAMSIVNGTGGNFSYPTLGLAGWLCASSVPSTCTSACPNNSAGEGEQFFNQITSSTQAAGYKLTGILGCTGAEGVKDGTDPDPYPPGCTPGVNCLPPQTGKQAIEQHMTAHCVHPTPRIVENTPLPSKPHNECNGLP